VTGFLVIGVAGLALLLVSLVFGEIFDGLFDALDVDAGGVLSTPVIGSFLAAFGFGAALLLSTTDVSAVVAAFGGVASGAVVGSIALVLTRSLMDMPTDESVRTSDLVGLTATVVTRIPDSGLGEVTVTHLGQLLKLSARSAAPVPAGSPVRITTVLSSSSVLVEPLPAQGATP
jgi:hypothetical protein